MEWVFQYNMIKLTNVLVSTFPINYNSIQWELEMTQETLTDYRISIYRSEAQTQNLSDYVIVGSGINPFTDFMYLDPTISGLTNKFSEAYYVLQIDHIVSGYEQRFQGPYTHNPLGPMDYVSREVNRRKNIVLNQYSSQEYILLKRKTTGQTCPDHYDPILGRTDESHCLTCYDTGYAGGFYSPIEMKAQLNEGPTRNQIVVFGNWQDQDAILTTVGVPVIAPRDIIVDELNRRWEVVNVRSLNKALYTQEQSAQLRQIEKGDVVYEYPLDIDGTGFIYDTYLGAGEAFKK